MRTSMAYFAGAGTVVVAIVAGVGGGLIMADIVSPKSPKQGTEQTLLERRMPPKPVEAATAPSVPVPYLVAAPQPAAPATAVAAAPAQPQAPTETANASTPAQPTDVSQIRQPESPPKQAEAPATQPAAPAVQPVVHEQAAAPDDASAKPRGGEARRAEGNRKFEHRQQWTERRRYKSHQQQELIAVEEKVREDTEPRRELAADPVKIEMPLIRLFGPE
jgi:hypothetical protein